MITARERGFLDKMLKIEWDGRKYKLGNPHPFGWLSVTTTSLERKVKGYEFCNIIHFTSRRGRFGLRSGIILPDVRKKFNHFEDVLQCV